MQKGIFIPTFLAFALSILFLTIPVTPSYAATCSSPDGEPGAMIFNQAHDVFQGCTPDGWIAFHKAGAGGPSGPSGCPNIGDTCSDGTIYAGLTPDGNIPMYAMPTDGPAGGFSVAPTGGYTWNDGSSNYVDTAMVNCTSTSSTSTSCNTGRANTTFLAAITGASPAPYKAAQYCENLTSNGYSDWYLPAQNELRLLYNLYVAGKGGFVADYYWSSSELNNSAAWSQYFSSGLQLVNFEYLGLRVRCVRQHEGTVTPPVQDDTPDSFSFASLTNRPLDQFIGSNVVTVTGIGPDPVALSIAGDGDARVSVNDAPWEITTTIKSGDKLQLYLRSANATNTTYTATVTLGTFSTSWNVSTKLTCPPSPVAGDEGCVMGDGSLYAGKTPDGNHDIFTTPADAASALTWNNGGTNYLYTGMSLCDATTDSGCITGRSNTTLLAGLSNADSPHAAAKYCEDLTAHGKGDWYLPARNELNVLYSHRDGIGNFITESTMYYWSSSEIHSDNAWVRYFGNGAENPNTKHYTGQVRCIRNDAPAQDNTPNAFSFTALTDQLPSTLIESNTVTIQGIGPSPVAIVVSGSGTPQMRINGGAWINAGTNTTIQNNQTLQLRMTTASTPSSLYPVVVTLGTANVTWNVTTGATVLCPTTPGAGDVGCQMSDGTIYAGLTPDGNVPMYAMPTDGPAGGYSVAPIGGYTWNDGSSTWVDTAMVNCTSTSDTATGCNTGRANTTLLAAITGASPAPYRAAQYCENLTSNGYSDWYLPAQNELKLLYNLYVAGKGGFVADLYWSSSEFSNTYAWNQSFSSGGQGYGNKNYGLRVRCVRTDASADETPNAFSFTDVTEQLLNVVITSNTVTVNGIGSTPVNVSVSGAAGTPEFSVNGGTWRTASTTISNGQTLQVRMRSGMTVSNTRSVTVTVGTVSDQWDVTTAAVIPACTGTLTLGQICPDGTVYAGVTPDGNAKMYTTPADATGGGRTWNNGNSDPNTNVDTALINCVSTETGCRTGRLNTAILDGLSDSDAPYVAAKYCADLTAHGHDDWYLPAYDELKVLATNRYNMGTHLFTGNSYWSSSESMYAHAFRQYLPSNSGGANGKFVADAVRCVRNENAAPVMPDYTPNNFSFTNLTGQPVYTEVESNAVTISGLGSAGAQVSANGLTVTYSINGGPWINGMTASTITNGQTLKVRGYTSAIGSVNTVRVYLGTYNTAWTIAASTDACADSYIPTGTVCEDGTIYAGETYDGNSPMFITPDDAPDWGYTWNNGDMFSAADTPVANCSGGYGGGCDTGRVNTMILASLNATGSPYYAARYCQDLYANGHDDWYLPAKSELETIISNMTSHPTAGLTGTYWTSSEVGQGSVYYIDSANYYSSNSGNPSQYYKVRCARNKNAPPTMPDFTPDAFTFNDLTDQPWNSVALSDFVLITGISPDPVSVSVTGTGNPQVNINNTGWVTSGTISAGQSLQVRLTSASAATTLRSAIVTVGAVSEQWDVTTSTSSCPNVGDTCFDGTIYAGLSQDGNAPMYAMPSDGPAGTYTWNDGSGTYPDTAMVNCGIFGGETSCHTGRANTAFLATITGGSPAPYKAAQYCENLTSNGHSDWYLPADSELYALYGLYGAGKGGFAAAGYWSSSEATGGYVWYRYFADGSQSYIYPNLDLNVRCVRRESDDTPNAFDFNEAWTHGYGPLDTNIVTITGIGPGAVAASVTGEGTPQIRIDGGPWITTGTINNGQTIQARMNTVAPGGVSYLTVTVGTVSATWAVHGDD